MFNYSDFQAGILRNFQFAQGINRNEYRQGVLNAAQARLFEQDLNRDGVLTFDEVVNSNEYAKRKSDAFNCQPSAELCGSYQDYADTQQAKMRIRAEEFKALDVNQDGVLDQRELANEINLMDRLGGKEDGIVSQNGFNKLWNNSDPKQIGAMLRDNYRYNNMKNLGMPWDKFGKNYSRRVGEICNPFNLNSPMAAQGVNPFAQQLINPIAQRFNPLSQMYNPIAQGYNPLTQQLINPIAQRFNPLSQMYNPIAQGYNPLAQGYNPISYRPMAQSICPCQANKYRQLRNNNMMLSYMQNIINQFIEMMKMQNAQYATY